MREILFRGKHFKSGKWCIGNPQFMPTGAVFMLRYANDIKTVTDKNGKNCYDVLFDFDEVIPETVCQYTGLTDKNGNRMFDGDIIDISYFLTKNRAVVKFGKYKQSDMSGDYECGNQGFYVSVENDEHDTYRHDLYFYAHKCEIIGNIFDNPELLEVENG